MIFAETTSNPSLRVVDVAAIAKLAHSTVQNVLFVVDNTVLTSYYHRPLDSGADIVMYSLTKFMGGHNDVLMGALVMNEKQLYDKYFNVRSRYGYVPSPFDCYLINRSLKTLPVRMDQHSKNALAIAEYLEKHADIVRVKYPGLKSHPQHGLAQRQFSGHSGLLSFQLIGTGSDAKRFIGELRLILSSQSLGSFASLASLP